MRYEFAFEAERSLNAAALRCMLWKRGGVVGPIALVLFPILLMVLATDSRYRTAVAVIGGAALMLFVLALLAIQHRRRMRDRFFATAPNRQVRIVLDDDGVNVGTSLGETALRWTTFERAWRCEKVVLLFHNGWQYIAMPAGAVPGGAFEFVETSIHNARTRRPMR